MTKEPIPMDPIRQSIADAATERNVTLKSLSKYLGKSDAYMHQFLNYRKPIKLDGDDRDKLADFLRLDRDHLRELEGDVAVLGRTLERTPVFTNLKRVGDFDLSPVRTARGEEDPAPNLRSAEMPDRLDPSKSTPIPVLGMVQGGSDGSFLLNTGEPIMHVERPIGLAGRKRIYALKVEGGSMEPAHYDGDLIFVDPGRTPYPKRTAVIELHAETENDSSRAFLKEIVKINGEFIIVKEYNPEPREFRIDRSRIRALHLVLRNNEIY